jgi:hypothetical protein
MERNIPMIRNAVLAVVVAVGSSAAFAQSDADLSRVGNVRFKMPAGWKKADAAGYTTLVPPDVPAGKLFEVRLLHGFEYDKPLRSGFDELLALVKAGGKVLKEGEVSEDKHPSAGPVVATALAMQLPDNSPRFWIVWTAKPGNRIQGVFVVADDPEYFTKQVPEVEGLLVSMKFLNVTVLAEGAPPLTEYLVEEGLDFLEWSLDVPFTGDQRKVFREDFIDSWKKKKQEDIDGVLQIQQLRAKLATMKPEEQDLARKALETALVDAWRKDKDKDNERSTKLILEIYDASRKPIAAGDPPLTRQAADAFLEATYFIAAKIEGIGTPTPTKEEREEWAKKLAETYGKLDADQRKVVSQMPLVWAALRVSWNDLKDADRQELQRTFKEMPPVAAVCAKFAEIRKQSDSPTAALKLMQKMQNDRLTFNTLSNISQMMHRTNMQIIRNMNPSIRYVYRPR